MSTPASPVARLFDAGDAYTFEEYRRMFTAAGFPDPTLHPLDPTPQHAVVATVRP
jgi:hypothetical protein